MASFSPNWPTVMAAAVAAMLVVVVTGASVDGEMQAAPENDLMFAGDQEARELELREDIDEVVTEPRTCTSSSCPKPLMHDYMSFEQIEWFLHELAAHSPRVDLYSIGKSHEHRNIWMVHIKPPTPGSGSPKGAWIGGGIHGMEWISVSVAIHMIYYMATSDTLLPPGCNAYLVPVANPDGYKYTWGGPGQRFWRKNRRNMGSCCGVDLNRNWDWYFGYYDSSSSACHSKYHGYYPFSEPETYAMKHRMKYINSICDLRLVLSLKSCGQQLLYPWSHSYYEAPYTSKMIGVGKSFLLAANKREEVYSLSNAYAYGGRKSGTMVDWAKGVLHTRYAYTLLLPDKGEYGYALPPSKIQVSVQDARRGIKRILHQVCDDAIY